MGVVYQPIQDSVGQGGVLHGSMPGFYRQLTGDDGGFAVIAFFDNLQEFPLFFEGQRGDEEIVQDQHLAFADRCEEFGVAAIEPGDRNFLQQSGDSLIQGRVAVATGLLRQGTGEIALAGPGWSGHQDIVMALHPVVESKRHHGGAVQAPPLLEVEIFKAGGETELGVFEPVAHPSVFQIGHLVVDKQGKTLLKGELGHVGGLHLVGKGSGHGGELHGVELVNGRLGEHVDSSRWCNTPRL